MQSIFIFAETTINDQNIKLILAHNFITESLILTAVIPDIDNLKLDQAEVTAFSNTLTPELIIGPGVYSSSGKVCGERA